MADHGFKVGAKVKGTTTKGKELVGTVTAVRPVTRGVFVDVDGGEAGIASFRPSQVQAA